MPVPEKTFELNLCTEMVYYFRRWLGRRIIWFGPSLHEEARYGFDVAAMGLVSPFFVQFKVGTLRAGGPITRFGINNNSLNNQHSILVSLSRFFPVLYGFPIMFDMADIERNQWQLLAQTCWIDVNSMPPFPAPVTNAHSVDVDQATYSYQIRSTDQGPHGQGMRWTEALRQSIVPRLEAMEGSRVIELVDEVTQTLNTIAVDEVGQSLDNTRADQDDISDGLACGLVI